MNYKKYQNKILPTWQWTERRWWRMLVDIHEIQFQNKGVECLYDNRCAVTRIQLRLVDATHILPVPSGDSSDHVTNGMALLQHYIEPMTKQLNLSG